MRYSDKQPLWDNFRQYIKQPLSLVNTKIYSIAQTRLVVYIIIGFIPKELYLSPQLETNISGLNTLIKQTWKEAIAIIDHHKGLTNRALSIPLGLAVRKVCSPWI